MGKVFRDGVTWSNGNEKLGHVMVINRPVGTTCPSTCPLLGNGCYAEKIEERFPGARLVARENLTVSAQKIRQSLDSAKTKGLSFVRVHANGDFAIKDKLDISYISAWRKALRNIQGVTIWAYTHIYRRALSSLPNINLYASVHNRATYEQAKTAGFRLFAFVLEDKKRKGGSADYPKYVDTLAGRALVCPEQRLGRERVTCDKCKWCIRGMGHVAFLTH